MCANWCLNNVAKGIARDELSYAMEIIYERFRATYSNADYDNMWKAAFDMLYLFGDVARTVDAKLGFDVGALILFFMIMCPNFIWFAVPAPNDILRGDLGAMF